MGGAVGGAVGGSVEGAVGGSVEGAVGGSVEGSVDGSVEGSVDGFSGGTLNGGVGSWPGSISVGLGGFFHRESSGIPLPPGRQDNLLGIDSTYYI